MKDPSISIICATCKHSRPFHLPMYYYCRKKHQQVDDTDLCEDWLPSKVQIKYNIEVYKQENQEETK